MQSAVGVSDAYTSKSKPHPKLEEPRLERLLRLEQPAVAAAVGGVPFLEQLHERRAVLAGEAVEELVHPHTICNQSTWHGEGGRGGGRFGRVVGGPRALLWVLPGAANRDARAIRDIRPPVKVHHHPHPAPANTMRVLFRVCLEGGGGTPVFTGPVLFPCAACCSVAWAARSF